MKKTFLFMLIFVGILFAQSVTVTSVEAITTLEQGKFFYPVSNYDNSNILFSSENYKGLWMMDLINGNLKKINDFYGAGYEAGFTRDDKIIFRKDEFVNNLRYISLYEYNTNTEEQSAIEEKLRGISEFKNVNGEGVIYSRENKLVKQSNNNKLNKTLSENYPALIIENSDIVIYNNDERIVLNPMGDGNYLWASVSPDGNKLLFTLAGKGSFVTSLNGEVIGELGYANYPQWSNNSKWVVFMKDYDDGEQIIDSELFVSSIDGKTQVNITNTKDVYEMYPKWSKTKDEIFCNSSDGIIYKIELKFN
jgi:Tol biopolymer transport system component